MLNPFKWWRKRQRDIDLKIMWPIFKEETAKQGLPLDDARRCFYIHAMMDDAWTKDFTEKEIFDFASRLR